MSKPLKDIERLALDYGRVCIQWAIADERAYQWAHKTHDDPDKASEMYERFRPSQTQKQAALQKLLDRVGRRAVA